MMPFRSWSAGDKALILLAAVFIIAGIALLMTG